MDTFLLAVFAVLAGFILGAYAMLRDFKDKLKKGLKPHLDDAGYLAWRNP